MKILVIDDSAHVSSLLLSAIRQWGHRAVAAETGRQALEAVRQAVFDLILLDIYLPDTVAYDLIPKLRQTWDKIEIITMTGHSCREVEMKIRSQGILYYMVKPVDLGELKSIIQHLEKKSQPHNA